MLKAYIVEDEPLARDELKYLLIQSKQVEVVGEADNLEDAVTAISNLKPDLVFLDIELEATDGLELAEQLLTLNPTPAIVFATAYDEYAMQAFELNALDYLLKPFDDERIRKTLEKIKQLGKIGVEKRSVPSPPKTESMGKIPVLITDRIVLLENDAIVYLESFEGKCTIKTMDDTYIVSDTLSMLEKKLNSTQFMRVHRSYIVNIDHIVEIHPWFNSTFNLILKDHSKVPVSRTYVKEFKRLVGF